MNNSKKVDMSVPLYCTIGIAVSECDEFEHNDLKSLHSKNDSQLKWPFILTFNAYTQNYG